MAGPNISVAVMSDISALNIVEKLRAVQLTNTVNEMMKSGEYKFVRNTYDKLMEIADKFNADDNGVIEVGHYGHSEPRKKVVELGIVEVYNETDSAGALPHEPPRLDGLRR